MQGVQEVTVTSIVKKFISENEIDLAHIAADAYLDKFSVKEQLTGKADLLDLAGIFLANKDAVFAEKAFLALEKFYGVDAFNEDSLYTRAFNLEGIRDYESAYKYFKEIGTSKSFFHQALIKAYCLHEANTAKEIFAKLGAQEGSSPESITSLYHLGLINQWQGNLAQAKEAYLKVKEKIGSIYPYLEGQVLLRLAELEKNAPIEYKLKNFLDLALNEDSGVFGSSQVEIGLSTSKLKLKESLKVSTNIYTEPTGCMPIEKTFLWSGNLGVASPENQENKFDTSYEEPGIQIIYLVVASQSNNFERAVAFLEVVE